MKTLKLALAISALLSVAGIAYVAQQAETSGPSMVSAAEAFVGAAESGTEEASDLRLRQR